MKFETHMPPRFRGDVELDVSKYKLSHGCAPRGRGLWAFCPASRYDESDYTDHCFFASGTYSEAVRALKENLRERRGHVEARWVVCS